MAASLWYTYMLKFLLKWFLECARPLLLTCSCLFPRDLINFFILLFWVQDKKQDNESFFYSEQQGFFVSVKKPGGWPQSDQCLILLYTMKFKMFFTVFTFINRNRMCSSKWWHAEGKPTGYWTGHFKLKKEKKVLFLKASHLFPQFWLLLPFFCCK